jgi:exosome complex component RRP4
LLFNSGHGTYKTDNQIYSALMGTVEITNKLIIVNAIKSRYQPQTGDIVVGRIVEVLII